jgi:hypothetical protein
MSATSGARNEYSRGSGGSGRDSGRSRPPSQRPTDEAEPRAGGLILAATLLAALFLLVAEFTTLYQVHEAGSSAPIKTVTGGSNHSYAMLVIALGAVGLGVLVWRSGSRSALFALGVLGVVALLIAILGDLPDSQASGLAGSAGHGYMNATSTPSAGLYLETLGAILLIATSGLGFLTLGPRAKWRLGGTPRPDGRPPSPQSGDGNRRNGGDAPAWTRNRHGGSGQGR